MVCEELLCTRVECCGGTRVPKLHAQPAQVVQAHLELRTSLGTTLTTIAAMIPAPMLRPCVLERLANQLGSTSKEWHRTHVGS